ncbi:MULTISPECIES: PEP-CTERM sorting domain-containing protein [unclassified Schlesneria]|uniref:PEP-CTERM sorting domain-containing protein n=1 Tax=unclassified Schlesneria TaxID=2762017 RepID=UPI002EE2C65A
MKLWAKQLIRCSLFAAIACFVPVQSSLRASPIYLSSDVTISFDPDSAVIGDEFTVNGSGVGGITLNESLTKGGGTTYGYGFVNTVTYPSLIGFFIGNGTGVTRVDPPDAFLGTSSLEINLHGLWRNEGAPWGPPVIDFAHFGVRSNNEDAVDVGRFVLSVDWHNGNTYQVDKSFTQVGEAFEAFNYLALHNPSPVPVGTELELTAFIGLYFTGNSLGGTTLSPSGTAVPEPSTFALAGLGVVSVLVTSLRKKTSPAAT